MMLPGTHQQLMIVEQNPLRQRLPTNLVFTICQEMCGSGAMTGSVPIAAVHRPIQQVLPRALTAWTVVAAFAATPGAAVCRAGAAARLPAGPTTVDCASALVLRLSKICFMLHASCFMVHGLIVDS